DAFKAAYPGIEVEAYDMTDVEQVDKLTREQGAGIYNVDVLFTAGITTLTKELLPNHLLWNYVPSTLVDGVPAAQVIPVQFREPLLVHSLEAKIVFYNFESNPAGCPVDSLWDLTRPEWRGRIQMKDPLLTEENMNFLQTIVQHADAMAAAYEVEFGKPLVLSPGCANAGYEFIKRIVANGIVLTQSDGDASKAVGTAGQTNPPLTLSVSSSKIRDNAKGQKLAIGWDIKPVVGITKTNYLAIANLAPHPNAAKLLIRFMVGDADGKAGYVPFYVEGQWNPRTDMTPPLREVTLDTLHQKTWFLDPDWIYEHGLEVQDFWLSLH
ncbi:MAG: ABC transporter substrate-binding protein, partial [Candidatus Bipolaricaulota bacterium]